MIGQLLDVQKDQNGSRDDGESGQDHGDAWRSQCDTNHGSEAVVLEANSHSILLSAGCHPEALKLPKHDHVRILQKEKEKSSSVPFDRPGTRTILHYAIRFRLGSVKR